MLQAKKPSIPQTAFTKQRHQPLYQTVGDRLRLHARLIAVLVGAVLTLFFCIGGVLVYRGYQKNIGLQELQEGIVLLRTGEPEEAIAVLEKAEHRLKGETHLLALFFRGQALTGQKQSGANAERQVYEELVARAERENFIKQLALVRLGQEAERNRDASQAQRFYKEAADMNGPMQGVALLAHARVLERISENATAQALYEEFLEKYADSPLAEIVEQKKAE